MNIAYYKNQFMYDSEAFPEVDTKAYTLTLDADIITTESGREIPSAELTVRGDCPIQAGFQVVIPGIPHVYLVMEANFSESETRYVLHDAFAEVLSQKTLAISYDRSPLSPGALMTSINDSIISSIQKGYIDFAVEEVGATAELGFTSYGEAGQKMTDWIYETARNIGATVYIQSQITPVPFDSGTRRLCKAVVRWDYRKNQTVPYSVIKKTEVNQRLIPAEKNIVIQGRVQDKYATVETVKSDSGYSAVEKDDFSGKTCLKYRGEQLPAGSYYELTARSDETLTFGKDEVITLSDIREWLSFYGTFQKPYFLMHNGFVYVSATTIMRTLFDPRYYYAAAIFIPSSAVGVDGTLGAEVAPATLTGIEAGSLTSWKNGLTVFASGSKEGDTKFTASGTVVDESITFVSAKDFNYHPKSFYGMIAEGVRARMSIVYSRQSYYSEFAPSAIFFPLTTVWQGDFAVLDGSQTDPYAWTIVENLSAAERERIYSVPILHLHDLWRLPYLSMQAVKKISPKAPVETILTPSEVDFSKLEVGDVVTPFGKGGEAKKVTATILSFEGGKWTKDAELE